MQILLNLINCFHFQWGVELDEENEIQINMSGVAIGFVDRDKKLEVKKADSSSGIFLIQINHNLLNNLSEREMMFAMEDNSSDNVFDKSMKFRQLRQPQYFFTSNK